MTLTFMVSQVLFYRRFPGAVWARPEVAPAVALSLQIGLCMIDNLSNAMPNPLYAIAIGGMTGMTAIVLPSARRDAARRLAQADVLKEAGLIDAAEDAYTQAIGTYATAASETGRDPEILSEAAYSYEALADLLAVSPGRVAEAEPYLRSAIEIRETLAGADPERTDAFERLAADLEHLGRLLSTLTRFDEAERAWRRAVELHEGLAARFPAAPEFAKNWAEGLNDLAWLVSSRPDVDVDTARTAAGLALKAIELDPSRAGFWNTLGAANYHARDYESAAAALLRSIDLSDGGTGCDYYLLAMTNVRLGNFGPALECFERGDDWMKINAPNHPTLTHLRDQAAALLHV
jgi:tetratricopeptide (TPR) repeat protein